MKKDKIYRSLEFVRDEYLNSAADAMESGKYAERFRRPRVWIIAAACLLLVAILFTMPLFQPKEPNSTEPPEPIELAEIELTASDLAALFYAQTEGVGTKNYTTVILRNHDDFGLPDSEYLTIYQYDPISKPIDVNEYKEVVEQRKKRLMESMGVDSTDNNSDDISNENIIGITNLRDTNNQNRFEGYISTVQRLYSHEITYSQYLYYGVQRVYLDGELVAVRQSKSDEEIISSLNGIKEKLFSIFDVEFSDIKIIRSYGKSNEIASSVMVYFYNEADHPLNSILERPVSDSIHLSFSNYDNRSQALISDDLLTKVDIWFEQSRIPVNELYKAVGKVKTLPLEKAEEYLSKGYVFGGYHACPICRGEELESQPLVDFTEYDYVDLEYVTGRGGEDDRKNIIPFYAFYKYIGDNDYGEALYAKTYVPAIEVEGIVEYFSHQS